MLTNSNKRPPNFWHGLKFAKGTHSQKQKNIFFKKKVFSFLGPKKGRPSPPDRISGKFGSRNRTISASEGKEEAAKKQKFCPPPSNTSPPSPIHSASPENKFSFVCVQARKVGEDCVCVGSPFGACLLALGFVRCRVLVRVLSLPAPREARPGRRPTPFQFGRGKWRRRRLRSKPKRDRGEGRERSRSVPPHLYLDFLFSFSFSFFFFPF